MNKRYISGLVVFVSGFLFAGSVFSAELYVDGGNPKAADTNAGTEQAPFKTIAAAAGKLQPGDTVYVKPGLYREQATFPAGKEDARISVLSYDKKNRPVITGSEVITSKWTLTDVKVKYEGTQPVKIYTTPLEAYTQMVFVDDAPVKQIGIYKSWPPQGDTDTFRRVDGKGPEDMRPGTFYYDRDRKILYLWLTDSSDPSKKNIEASVRDYGIIYSDYTTISGFEVKNCQLEPNKGHFGIGGSGKKVIVENCYAHHNDFVGIIVNGEDSIIQNNEMSDNGFVGFTCSWGIRNLWDGNVTHNNNTRRYKPGWGDGGMKIHEVRDSKVLHHYAYDEPGSAIWVDINGMNILIAESLVENCGVGIYYEISRWGLIFNNVIRNSGLGIWSYSSDVLIANNVLDRCTEGIIITGDARGAEYSLGYPEPARMCLDATRNNMIVNNIIIDSVDAFIGISKDTIHCGNNYSDYNAFVWTIPSASTLSNHIKFFAGWDDYYSRLQFWQIRRHNDFNSTISDPILLKHYNEGRVLFLEGFNMKCVVGDALFTDREKGDYRLKPGSPLLDKGVEVPAELASVYYYGIRPWRKTLLADAPANSNAKPMLEVWAEKHYRAQPEPSEPLLMFDPDKQKRAPVGLNTVWIETGKYPEIMITEKPADGQEEEKHPRGLISENIVNESQFENLPDYTEKLTPWIKTGGNFHIFSQTAVVNLIDYSPVAGGCQYVGVIKPNTFYTLNGDMAVRTIIKDVSTMGKIYLAVGETPQDGKLPDTKKFVILGTPVEVTVTGEGKENWRRYQTVYNSGAAGEDKNTGMPLYVVMDGMINGAGVNPNGGNPNGQVSWDNFRLIVEELFQ